MIHGRTDRYAGDYFLFGSRRWRYTRSPAAQANDYDWCDAESGEDLIRPVDADGLYQEVQQQGHIGAGCIESQQETLPLMNSRWQQLIRLR